MFLAGVESPLLFLCSCSSPPMGLKRARRFSHHRTPPFLQRGSMVITTYAYTLQRSRMCVDMLSSEPLPIYTTSLGLFSFTLCTPPSLFVASHFSKPSSRKTMVSSRSHHILQNPEFGEGDTFLEHLRSMVLLLPGAFTLAE